MPDHDRLHALDAVRAFALLAGIVLHATISFLPILSDMLGLEMDRSVSPIPQAIYYVIHIFRMATFYFIAGFFAHMVFHRKGFRAFFLDRAKRILVPLLVGWITIGPLIFLILIWGTKHISTETIPAQRLPQFDFPLFHLWFLYYLLMFYALVLFCRWCFVKFVDAEGRIRNRIDGWLRLLVKGYMAPLLLATPLAVCLYVTPNWNLWFGIPTPDFGLAPQIPALVGYGTALAFGWLVHRQTGLLQVWKGSWFLHLAFAVAATAICYRMVGSTASDQILAVSNSFKLIYAACYCLAIWNWVFAIVGTALRFFSGASRVQRYVSDSSYWLYLIHLPLVMALQVLMMQWNPHWSIKFISIIIIATALLLVSYHYLVRFTYVGEILNGRRRRRTRIPKSLSNHSTIEAVTAPLVTPSVTESQDSAVAQLSGVYKRYGKTVALDGINLQIPRGKLLAILGPNGAGKTTAISLMLGLLETDAGAVTVLGHSPHLIDTRRQIGVMMQEVTLSPELRARELIDLAASYYPTPLSVDKVMELTNTASLAKRCYGKLSGGQKRQIQLTMALVGRPKLLFLDEPTVGLDVKAREMMWRVVRKLLSEGISIVLTTHYLEEAEALADQVAVLAKGRLIALGSVNEVRSLVARKQIRCITRLSAEQIKHWSSVQNVRSVGQQLHITVIDAEDIVRRLLEEDANLKELEVSRAGLAEAFTEITKEVA